MKKLNAKILLKIVCSIAVIGCGAEDLDVSWCSSDITNRRQICSHHG